MHFQRQNFSRMMNLLLKLGLYCHDCRNIRLEVMVHFRNGTMTGGMRIRATVISLIWQESTRDIRLQQGLNLRMQR